MAVAEGGGGAGAGGGAEVVGHVLKVPRRFLSWARGWEWARGSEGLSDHPMDRRLCVCSKCVTRTYW